jgi:hypothetical protein
MHAAAFDFVKWAVDHFAARGPVLELGSRNINGSVRGLFAGCAPPYIGVDLVAGPGVDVVADAATYVPSVKMQTVVCCEVFEHTLQAPRILRHIARQLLAANGLVIVTCATTGRLPHSAVDGGPLRLGEFYRNCSETEFQMWGLLAGLDGAVLATTPAGDLYYVGTPMVF